MVREIFPSFRIGNRCAAGDERLVTKQNSFAEGHKSALPVENSSWKIVCGKVPVEIFLWKTTQLNTTKFASVRAQSARRSPRANVSFA